MLLSVIIPVYNEEKTIEKVVQNVESVVFPQDIRTEIIIVNDGSSDGTELVLKSMNRHTIINQLNTGKGGAVRAGMKASKGDFVIIQDADLEQNPHDIPQLLKPVYNRECDVVFGSRFIVGYKPKGLKMTLHYFINKGFTFLANLITGISTTDIWTGYKLYSREAVNRILPVYKSNGIEFELEISVLLSKFKFKVKDVPVTYKPRWYNEGKKTNWTQGIYSLLMLLKFTKTKVELGK